MLIRMATRTLLSEQEYLNAHFEDPEPDFVDGELVERTMPNMFHSAVQVGMTAWFLKLSDSASLHPFTELRLRVTPERYRVADLVVFRGLPSRKAVPDECPFVVLEIASPDDRYSDIMSKLDDYAALGVPHVWLADPEARRLSVYQSGDLRRVPAFTLPEFNARITLEQVLG